MNALSRRDDETEGVSLGAKKYRPEPSAIAVDIEGGGGGRMTHRDIKQAREVAEDVITELDFQRLSNRISDALRDEDSSLTRATRDRDRATPRDVSHVDSPRLSQDLPVPDEFRGALTARQRKLRCAIKNQVMNAAPESQKQAMRTMVTDDSPEEWRRINRSLHRAAGDVHELDGADRKTVQRLDRLIQSYERQNDRHHKVYVSVQLPDNHRDVISPETLPENLQPGRRIAFDQFTAAKHNLHETPGVDSPRHLVFELVTGKGMYLGRSDTVEDTTHLLPRGCMFTIASAEYATYADAGGGFGDRLVLQLRES
ncbi:hypothetical protein [Mycolicibacterium llatzerense]|uniref:hypothetical protein n=1 Tax=Mycolicibacterium llatzerense TaxID=280871 RepID=UPI000ADEA58E|nr:hypothetical protein [Mycolicibacterium llatzerense]